MTPSRSAHGQMSSASTPSRSIAASATTAPASSCRARAGETPGQRGALRRRSSAASRSTQSRDVGRLAASAAAYGPSEDGRGPGDPGQRAQRLADVPTTRSGGPAWMMPRSTARRSSARTCLRSARTVVGAGRVAGQRARGSAGRRPAAGSARRPAPRPGRPRSPASRRRCRARAAARWTSRTSGARRGRSAAPRPRRRAPAGRRPGLVAHLAPAPPRRWAPRGSRWWRRRARSSHALVLGDLQARPG